MPCTKTVDTKRAFCRMPRRINAAIVASVGAGLHATVTEAAGAMADRGTPVDPEPSWAGPTAAAYAGWRERVQRMDENTMRVSHMIGPR